MNRFQGIIQRINRKVVLLGAVVLLLAAAIVVNVIASNREAQEASAGADPSDPVVSVSTVNAGFFESFRLDRDQTREREIEYLDAIIDQGADTDTLADAQQQKLSIVTSMEKEMTVESLLLAKGFLDAAVTVHTGSVNVILSVEEPLNDEQIAQILDIVIRETGEPAENIKVTAAQS